MCIITSLAAAALSLIAMPAAAQDASLIAHGEQVARAGDCTACHQAARKGGKTYSGGYVIASPIGRIVAPNITPSKTAGIGAWSFEDFDRAMRKGISRDRHRLYPAMPYTEYQGISDADMRALMLG